ncbi:MAG: DUF72 domain-containing protein [Desulfobacteraceae bacterium]
MNSPDHTISPPPACRLRVGTSGYSYPEWVDAGFYGPGTPAREMLSRYARTFSATELNYTWYQMPKAAAMERMVPRVPADFRFAAKLTRTLTHEIDPHGWRGQAAQFREGVAPLVQARRLLAVLIQLPPSFDVFTGLHDRRVTLVTVDGPDLPYLFPALDVVTNPDLIYLRFHGRNARGWRSGNMQKQFDYDYSPDELQAWSAGTIPGMASQARAGIIFFNNHVRAQAPRNARILMAQLEAQGFPSGVPGSNSNVQS